MANQQSRKGGGGGSKSSKNPGAASRKAKRIRSHARLEKKKAANVLKSSKGKWTWERLVAHGKPFMEAGRKRERAARSRQDRKRK